MSHTKSVKITINLKVNGQNHNVKDFCNLISKLSELLDSQNIAQNSIGEKLI
jgi:Tfp pilus assembly protein PilO